MAEAGSVCQPCARGGTQIKSTVFCDDCDEYLCEKCRKIHRKFKSLMSHVIHDKADMKDGSNGTAHNGLRTCSIHSGRPLEYYCTLCCVWGCESCIPDNHTGCTGGPVHFPDIFKCLAISKDGEGFENEPTAEDCENIKKGLHKLKEGVRTVTTRMHANISESKKTRASVTEATQRLNEGMGGLLTSILGLVAASADEIRNEAGVYCEDVIKEAGDVTFNIDDVRTEIKSAKAVGDQRALLEAVKKMNRPLENLRDVSTGTEKRHIRFLNSLLQMEMFTEAINSFGKDVEFDDVEAAELADFSLQLGTDKWPCRVTGAIVTSGVLFVADRNNKKLKVFNRKSNLALELPLHSLFR